MMQEEPIEKLEEIIADKTFSAHKRMFARKNPPDEWHELSLLLAKLPTKPPKPRSKEYAQYTQQILSLKEKISKKHDELMEILKNEEKTIREIREKKP